MTIRDTFNNETCTCSYQTITGFTIYSAKYDWEEFKKSWSFCKTHFIWCVLRKPDNSIHVYFDGKWDYDVDKDYLAMSGMLRFWAYQEEVKRWAKRRDFDQEMYENEREWRYLHGCTTPADDAFYAKLKEDEQRKRRYATNAVIHYIIDS